MPRRRLAVGLLQLDICAALGEPALQHRYCTDVVRPLLDLLASNPDVRLGLAAAGAALEFLAENHPDELGALSRLAARGQIELISSVFAPAAWPLFPFRDLLSNIELNRGVLRQLGLPPSRAFHTDDGFFGPGVEKLAGEFDYALCRDTYFTAWAHGPCPSGLGYLGRMPVLIGAGSILDELARDLIAVSGPSSRVMSTFHKARIEEAVRAPLHSAPAAVQRISGGISWHWYHFGPAHPFACTAGPRDRERLFSDAAWLELVSGQLRSLSAAGWNFATPSMLFDHLKAASATQPLPVLPDGGWDPRASAGMLQWSGRLNQRHSPAAQLALIWRARPAALAAGDGGQDAQQHRRLLALAQSAHGLDPAYPAAAMSVREAAEHLPRTLGSGHPSAYSTIVEGETHLADAEVYGADGNLAWFRDERGAQVCEARFRQEEGECGVRFRLPEGTEMLAHCPCGHEANPIPIPLDRLRPLAHWLPLPNGLISLADGLHVIRVNATCPVPAHVEAGEPWLEFGIEAAEGKIHEWRFFVLRGERNAALARANSINAI